jgi:hypothetical protein
MSSFGTKIVNETSGFAHRVGPIVFVLVATVFTWGLIDSARRSMLQPWLLSQLPVHHTRVKVNGEVINLGDFYAAAIVWAFVMLILLFIWFVRVSHKHLRVQ